MNRILLVVLLLCSSSVLSQIAAAQTRGFGLPPVKRFEFDCDFKNGAQVSAELASQLKGKRYYSIFCSSVSSVGQRARTQIQLVFINPKSVPQAISQNRARLSCPVTPSGVFTAGRPVVGFRTQSFQAPIQIYQSEERYQCSVQGIGTAKQAFNLSAQEAIVILGS